MENYEISRDFKNEKNWKLKKNTGTKRKKLKI
jgi:hypothetical protein